MPKPHRHLRPVHRSSGLRVAVILAIVLGIGVSGAAGQPWRHDTTPPTPPQNLRESSATPSSVTVQWNPSTDNTAVVGYSVSTSTRTDQVRSFVLSDTLSGLTCGSTVNVSVVAFDRYGNRSTPATIAAATSSCSDLQPPTAPTALAVSSRTANSISLGWSASSDNVGVVDYEVYKGPTMATTSASTSATVSSLACGTTMTLAVDAVDAAGNRSPQTSISASTTACGDTTPPSTPTALTASGVTQTGATLSWAASTDNVGVVGYGVYQGTTSAGTTQQTSYPLTGLTCGTAYTFAVDAADAAGNRSGKAQTSFTTAACAAPASSPPPPPNSSPNTAGGQPGLGLMALGDTLSAYTSHLSSYSYVVISPGDEGVAQGLPGKTLTYTSPTIPSDQYDDPGVTYAQASANGWLLKDAAGNYIHPYNSTHRWALDVGSTALQQAFVSNVLAYLGANPNIKGIEIDNLLPDVAYFSIGRTWPAKYPSAQAWQDAEVAFLTAVGQQIRSHGYYVMVNATGYTQQAGYDAGTFDQSWFTRLATSGGCDAIFAEQWLQNPNSDTQLMDDSNPGSFMTSWSGWQRLESIAQNNGVDFFAINQGPSPTADPTTARHLMRYARGSFLLDWNGQGGMYSYTVDPQYTSRIDAWDSTWTQSIGTPVGAKTQVAADVWQRNYSGGFVVVNPTLSPVTVTINGTSYSVPAVDALIHFGS